MNYRADIDGLRALAVLSVVGFHAFPGTLRGGFVGVDIFFVISGFLISGLIFTALQQGRFSYPDFYARRIRRIFPALFTVLAVCLVGGLFWLHASEYKELGRQAAAGAGFLANFLFWSESGYFDSEAKTKPLLHLWSLGIEEQFYIVWPLLVAWFYRHTHRLLLVLAIVLVASFSWNVLQVHSNPTATFFLPMARFWELSLGAGLAYSVVLRAGRGTEVPARSRLRTETLSIIGLLLLAVSILLIDEGKAFPGWWALLPTIGAVLVIAAEGAWLNRRVLGNPLVVFFGLISYPLYLWHWVLLTAASRAGLTSKWDRLGAVALSLLLAWLTFVLIEKPIRFSSRSWKKTFALASVTALAGLSGAAIYATDGASFRYPPDVRALATFHYDGPTDYREGICQIDEDKPSAFASLAPQCVDPPLAGPSTLLVLWGDSHASSLYQGLRAQAEQHVGLRIAQFNAGGCPPLVGRGQFGRHSNCESFSDAALARIKELRPDIVVMEGWWLYYADLNGVDNEMSALRHTIAELKSAGVGRVVVFGSLPHWDINQPEVALRVWERTRELKSRTSEYLDPGSARVDLAVRKAVAETDAIFVSPMELLCNADGCLTSTDPNSSVPVAWDNSHLTRTGSIFLVNHYSPLIFGR